MYMHACMYTYIYIYIYIHINIHNVPLKCIPIPHFAADPLSHNVVSYFKRSTIVVEIQPSWTSNLYIYIYIIIYIYPLVI